jgi:hypothetical protein
MRKYDVMFLSTEKKKTCIHWKFITCIMSDIIYEYITRWKVPQVKVDLHGREWKASGMEVELVVLAYGTSQMEWKPMSALFIVDKKITATNWTC